MIFTWKHIIDLVKILWDINQNDIAEHLGVHRSTISRLKSGKQSRFTLPTNEIYKKLFDPDNPESPAHSDNPSTLLSALKEGIRNAGLTNLTENVKSDNYKEFVVGLLALAKKNQPPLPPKNTFSTIARSDERLAPNTELSLSSTNTTHNLTESNLSVSSECKICLCCKNWEGNAQDAYNSTGGTLGRCLLYSKETLSTKLADCNQFLPDYGHVLHYQFLMKQKARVLF